MGGQRMRSTETAMAHIVLLRCPKRNGVTPGNGAWAQGKLRQKHVALKSLLSFRGKGGKVHPKPAVKATLCVWCVWDVSLSVSQMEHIVRSRNNCGHLFKRFKFYLEDLTT